MRAAISRGTAAMQHGGLAAAARVRDEANQLAVLQEAGLLDGCLLGAEDAAWAAYCDDGE